MAAQTIIDLALRTANAQFMNMTVKPALAMVDTMWAAVAGVAGVGILAAALLAKKLVGRLLLG